jgi:O-6-methylguanine DNA methyltransferase
VATAHPAAAPATFRARVLRVVRRIPAGSVATYGDIAELAGSPRAWRAVGTILRESHDPALPAHRVIGAGGALGGYGSNLQLKRELLRAEGLEVGLRRVRRFDEVRWRANRSQRGNLSGRSRRPSSQT